MFYHLSLNESKLRWQNKWLTMRLFLPPPPLSQKKNVAQRNSSVVNSLVPTLPNWSWEKARPFPAPFQRETLPISKKVRLRARRPWASGRRKQENQKGNAPCGRTYTRSSATTAARLSSVNELDPLHFPFFFFFLIFFVVPLYTCFKCHLLFSRSAPFPLSNNNNNEIYEKKSDVWPSCWWNRFLKKIEKRRADDLATIFVVVLPLKDNDFVIWWCS